MIQKKKALLVSAVVAVLLFLVVVQKNCRLDDGRFCPFFSEAVKEIRQYTKSSSFFHGCVDVWSQKDNGPAVIYSGGSFHPSVEATRWVGECCSGRPCGMWTTIEPDGTERTIDCSNCFFCQ